MLSISYHDDVPGQKFTELLLQKRAASCDWMDSILMVLVQFWRVAVRTGTTKSRTRTPSLRYGDYLQDQAH